MVLSFFVLMLLKTPSVVGNLSVGGSSVGDGIKLYVRSGETVIC
jgi:hypothetical protein